MVRIKTVHIFQGVPCAVHRTQVEIADLLEVVDRVFVESTLPEPAAEAGVRRGGVRGLGCRAAGEWLVR